MSRSSLPCWGLIALSLSVSACRPGASQKAQTQAPLAQDVAASKQADSGSAGEPVQDVPRLQDKSQVAFALPELPKDADTFEPQTLMITGSGPHGEPGVKQVVSRTPTRVHVEMPSMRQEWLFVRNPKDGRRVNAFLVVHSRKVILAYPESDLRMEGIARGWADVIALDPKQVKASSRGVDPRRLHDPQARFADYRLFEISDWREELHEHGKPTDHHHGPGGHHHGSGAQADHSHDPKAPTRQQQ